MGGRQAVAISIAGAWGPASRQGWLEKEGTDFGDRPTKIERTWTGRGRQPARPPGLTHGRAGSCGRSVLLARPGQHERLASAGGADARAAKGCARQVACRSSRFKFAASASASSLRLGHLWRRISDQEPADGAGQADACSGWDSQGGAPPVGRLWSASVQSLAESQGENSSKSLSVNSFQDGSPT